MTLNQDVTTALVAAGVSDATTSTISGQVVRLETTVDEQRAEIDRLKRQVNRCYLGAGADLPPYPEVSTLPTTATFRMSYAVPGAASPGMTPAEAHDVRTGGGWGDEAGQ